jgi:hypothetical protein
VDLSLSIEKKGSEVLPSEEREMAAPEGEAPPEVSPLPSETRQCSGRGRGKSREKKRKGSPLGVSLLDCLSGFTSLEHLQHSVVSFPLLPPLGLSVVRNARTAVSLEALRRN